MLTVLIYFIKHLFESKRHYLSKHVASKRFCQFWFSVDEIMQVHAISVFFHHKYNVILILVCIVQLKRKGVNGRKEMWESEKEREGGKARMKGMEEK